MSMRHEGDAGDTSAAGAGTVTGVEGPVLDDAVVGGLLELGPSLVADVVELWGKQLGPALGQITQLQDGTDLPTLAKAAHSLRGSSSNVGARRLALVCRALEETARAGGPAASLPALASLLGTEAESARTALEQTVLAAVAAEATGRSG